jgi:HD-GYP domain-containing protein (c-di-GMP phosphodiesterase class II)
VTSEPDALDVLTRQLAELNAIGAALTAERDTERLLALILTKAREITASDAGSLYIVEPSGDTGPGAPAQLRFAIAQNASVRIPLHEATLALSDQSLAGHVALTGEIVNLEDAYVLPPGAPYSFNPRFDELTGYRTRSVLAVPMRTPGGRTIGAIQLINAKRDAAARIQSVADAVTETVPYTARHEALAVSLASQAAVALENSQLYGEIRRLFEGFVRASIVAIEARDPATSGHSFRVANLTVALAEAVDRADSGRFAPIRFSREEMRTLRYASLLHDFGKVGVREDVLVKAKKLYPWQLALVRERFKLARRSLEVASLRARVDCLSRGRADQAHLRRLDDELAAGVADLDRHLGAIEAANEPTVLPEGAFERLAEIASIGFEDVDGTTRALLDGDEVRLLSLRKGSLSEAERAEIELHVTHSFRFLSQIPWTSEIAGIPGIVRGHHEKLNGTGYPRKLSAPGIPVETRMMTISDIFDALAAADRPYKKAVSVERALGILDNAVEDGELDPDLTAVFREARIYDRWLVEPFQY